MATLRPPRRPLQPVDPSKADAVHRALVALYGPRPWPKGDDPLDELIGTILSQSTTDTNSGFIAQLLRAAGVDVVGFLAVPDDPGAIVAAGGSPVGSVDDLHEALDAVPAGDPLVLQVVRGAEELEVEVAFDGTE